VQALGNLMLDDILGLEKKDWHGFFLQQRARTLEARAVKKKALLASRKKGTRPSLELTAYAGKYRDRAYGEATIAVEGKRLVLAWSSFRVGLDHFHFDTFLGKIEKDVTTSKLADELVRFELDGNGQVTTMHLLGRAFRRGE
jgi:hypothetical protein